MKIWTKDPIKRVQLIKRIQKLADDSNKKKIKAAGHSIIVNKEMEIMVRPSYLPKKAHIYILYLVVFETFRKNTEMRKNGRPFSFVESYSYAH